MKNIALRAIASLFLSIILFSTNLPMALANTQNDAPVDVEYFCEITDISGLLLLARTQYYAKTRQAQLAQGDKIIIDQLVTRYEYSNGKIQEVHIGTALVLMNSISKELFTMSDIASNNIRGAIWGTASSGYADVAIQLDVKYWTGTYEGTSAETRWIEYARAKQTDVGATSIYCTKFVTEVFCQSDCNLYNEPSPVSFIHFHTTTATHNNPTSGQYYYRYNSNCKIYGTQQNRYSTFDVSTVLRGKLREVRFSDGYALPASALPAYYVIDMLWLG